MSIRCSGVASRSFIIGSRLWPPAISRASGWRWSAASASSTLVARSYSNGAGVCNAASSGPAGQPSARGADVLALFVLDRSVGADHRRAGELLRAVVADRGVQLPRGQAAALDVAQHPGARAGGGDRRLASQPRERERAARVDLADPRGVDLLAVREGA